MWDQAIAKFDLSFWRSCFNEKFILVAWVVKVCSVLRFSVSNVFVLISDCYDGGARRVKTYRFSQVTVIFAIFRDGRVTRLIASVFTWIILAFYLIVVEICQLFLGYFSTHALAMKSTILRKVCFVGHFNNNKHEKFWYLFFRKVWQYVIQNSIKTQWDNSGYITEQRRLRLSSDREV